MNKIAIVGEAWGNEERITRTPFVGATGKELNRLLAEAGIERSECFITNVFNLQPPGNQIKALCAKKAEVGGPRYPFPPLSSGNYVKPEFLPEVFRLWRELNEIRPNIIIALGNTALWATCGVTGIKSRRGAVSLCKIPGLIGTKVLPTIHPAALFRQWSDRPLVLADLMKARKESEYPEVRTPSRKIWLDPTIEDLYKFSDQYITDFLSVDIETQPARRLVTCVSLSPSKSLSIVLPFVDRMRPGYSYWSSLEEEIKAWSWFRDLMENPDIAKLFQGGIYDIQYIYRVLKIRVLSYKYDTMIKAHSQQPEVRKDLGFLGALHTDEISWKNLRPRGQATNKREE